MIKKIKIVTFSLWTIRLMPFVSICHRPLVVEIGINVAFRVSFERVIIISPHGAGL